MTTQGSPLYEVDPEGCYVFVRKATREEILDLASNILETRMRRSETSRTRTRQSSIFRFSWEIWNGKCSAACSLTTATA
jgi:hypothetical protein